MSVAPKTETKNDDSITDDLEQFIAAASEADPSFKDAIGDAEVLERLLDCLTALRRDRHISQTEVARRMGVRQPTVCEFEKASSDPKFSTLQR
jgi:DNA-binding transcriptional regulator YiaG